MHIFQSLQTFFATNYIKAAQVLLIIMAAVIGLSQPAINGGTMLGIVMLIAVGVIGQRFKEPRTATQS